MKLAAFILCTAVSLCAQAPAKAPPKAPAPAKQTPVEEDPGSRITLDVTRVNMLFTVSDKKGRFVTNLAKDDFEISEAKKPQNVIEFTAETDLDRKSVV